MRYWDELFCALFHGASVTLISFSGQGAWRCQKPGCRAQRRHVAALRDVQLRAEEGAALAVGPSMLGQRTIENRLAS